MYGQSPGGFVRPPGTCCDAHLKNVDGDGREKRSISKNNAGDIHKCIYTHCIFVYTLECKYQNLYVVYIYMHIKVQNFHVGMSIKTAVVEQGYLA